MNTQSSRDAILNCRNLEELFAVWKNKSPSGVLTYTDEETERRLQIDHGKKGFIADGLISCEDWSRQKRKVLFVLKEAYCDNVSEFKLCDRLREEGPWGSIWNRCAEWSYGITESSVASPIPAYPDLDREKANEYLRRVAILNLKKSDGWSSSSLAEIEKYADYDRDEIKKEIELINPDIVVCGYVFSVLQNCVYEKSLMGVGEFAGKWNNNWYYWTTALTGRPTLVIDFYHPANHFPAVMNYYAMTGIYYQAIHDQARINSVGRPEWLEIGMVS